MNWKLTLTYDGTPFRGWQVQPGLATIQGTLAATIHQITGESILPQGSGRTDAGVHALAQVCSFALTGTIPAANLLRALNHALPASIRILAAESVPDTFHARHSARAKTYEYRIFLRSPTASGPHPQTPDLICPPFLAPYVWDFRFPLDLTAMQTAATHLLGTHNFTSFATADPDLTQRQANAAHSTASSNSNASGYPNASDSGLIAQSEKVGFSPGGTAPNPIKTITESTFTQQDNLLIYRITGSSFLHHMVRNIVGTLTDTGRGALTPSDIPTILAAQSRPAAGPTAPAKGLFLHTVHYT